MENYIIYCHYNKINHKRYIGQTKQNPSQRWGKNGKEYIRKGNIHFASAIKKYGWDNFEHQILYTHLTKDEANKKEMELIKLYQTQNPLYGYNISAGGNSNTLSKEKKEQKRQLNYQMWKNGIFKSIINTPVYCIELNQFFESALEAERITHIDNSSIQKTCKKQQHFAGFMPNGQPLHWIYANEVNDEIINTLKNKKEQIKGIGIPLYCPELNEFFNSAQEVEKKYHIKASNIRSCIRGVQKTAGKHLITQQKLHWIERPDLIQSNSKLSEQLLKEIKNYG